jgi:chemotaxis protein methyltransferase CheR
LAEAEAACAAALERHRTSAELHDVHALLLAGAGRTREAAGALRQALYLDPSLIVAHVRMAEVQARLGNADAARRSLRNAESLLAALPPDAVVPASDGMPAAHLLRTVRSRMAMLGEGAG